jgi:hypothetical protein
VDSCHGRLPARATATTPCTSVVGVGRCAPQPRPGRVPPTRDGRPATAGRATCFSRSEQAHHLSFPQGLRGRLSWPLSLRHGAVTEPPIPLAGNRSEEERGPGRESIDEARVGSGSAASGSVAAPPVGGHPGGGNRRRHSDHDGCHRNVPGIGTAVPDAGGVKYSRRSRSQPVRAAGFADATEFLPTGERPERWHSKEFESRWELIWLLGELTNLCFGQERREKAVTVLSSHSSGFWCRSSGTARDDVPHGRICSGGARPVRAGEVVAGVPCWTAGSATEPAYDDQTLVGGGSYISRMALRRDGFGGLGGLVPFECPVQRGAAAWNAQRAF